MNSVKLLPDDDTATSKVDYIKGGGHDQIPQFMAFLSGLEFDIEQSHPKSTSIKINGASFSIDATNASKYGRNAFNRTVTERKPQNRYIILSRSWKDNVVKIQFNKEYDADVIRKKINDAIKEQVDREQAHRDKETNDELSMTEIANHYLSSCPTIKSAATHICVREKKIGFYIEDAGTINLNADNSFSDIHINKIEAKTIEDATRVFNNFNNIKTTMLAVLRETNIAGPVKKELQSWVTDAYSKSYNVKKKEYSKY